MIIIIQKGVVMVEYKQGKLGYYSANDRFGLLIADLWAIEGFHCGETFEYYDAGTESWIPTRIEMSWPDKQYYLVDTPIKGDDLEGLKIRLPK